MLGLPKNNVRELDRLILQALEGLAGPSSTPAVEAVRREIERLDADFERQEKELDEEPSVIERLYGKR